MYVRICIFISKYDLMFEYYTQASKYIHIDSMHAYACTTTHTHIHVTTHTHTRKHTHAHKHTHTHTRTHTFTHAIQEIR